MNTQPQTWEVKLANNTLTETEWQILNEMVENGEAENLEEAARILDFQAREMQMEETYYGL